MTGFILDMLGVLAFILVVGLWLYHWWAKHVDKYPKYYRRKGGGKS